MQNTQTRQLGKNNLTVSAIGLGIMGADHAYGATADRQSMTTLIRTAVDIGCNFFDTAPVYGQSNEILLGQAVKPIRNQTIVATKFGIVGNLEIVDGKPQHQLDSRPASIHRQVEQSLQNLDSDYIDLYYQHRIDPNVEPETVAETMNDLIKAGKIRHWGVSNAPLDYIRRAHAVCPITAMENQYSMVYRQPENDYFPLCKALNIGFVAYSPLGNGFLSGKISATTQFGEGDLRQNMKRFSSETLAKNQALLDYLTQLANDKKATPAQIVLAWEIAQGDFIVPIPGTTKLHRLQENVAAMLITLTPDEIATINQQLDQLGIDESHF